MCLCAEVEHELHKVGTDVRAAQSGMRIPHEGQIGENLGQLLRHELNNPLAGILGNAELLLSEIRRKNDGRMPQGGQTQLETLPRLRWVCGRQCGA